MAGVGSDIIGFSPITYTARTLPSRLRAWPRRWSGRLRRAVVYVPRLGQRCRLSSIRHLLVAGEDVDQATQVASALDVGLAAQGIDAGGGFAHLAAQHGQVGQGHHHVGAIAALGDAHGVEDGAVARPFFPSYATAAGPFAQRVNAGPLLRSASTGTPDIKRPLGRVFFNTA